MNTTQTRPSRAVELAIAAANRYEQNRSFWVKVLSFFGWSV